MGLGIAESLADLYGKLTVSQRQLDGAKSTKGGGGGKKAAEKSRKIQSLESQVKETRDVHACTNVASTSSYVSISVLNGNGQ